MNVNVSSRRRRGWGKSHVTFAALRQSTGDNEVAMLALDLAAKEGIDEERVIGALLNAVGLGIFEMSWNVTSIRWSSVVS
jgi:hypothetical protein